MLFTKRQNKVNRCDIIRFTGQLVPVGLDVLWFMTGAPESVERDGEGLRFGNERGQPPS